MDFVFVRRRRQELFVFGLKCHRTQRKLCRQSWLYESQCLVSLVASNYRLSFVGSGRGGEEIATHTRWLERFDHRVHNTDTNFVHTYRTTDDMSI